MGRQKISSIRRSELIHSTMAAIYKHGFANLTVAQIANDAEFSTSSIHYYFGGKDALLEATMQHLLSLLKSAHSRHLKDVKAPAERLHSVVQANFDETFLTKETCRVWTQFWAFAPYQPKLERLHRINRARVKSNIVFALRDLIPEEDLVVTTNAIQGYMDGVWVQIAQTRNELATDELQSEATRFINHTLDKYIQN